MELKRKDEILDKILSVEVLDAMADWVKVVNINGKILYANQALKDAVGYDPTGSNTDDLDDFLKLDTSETASAIEKNEIIQKELNIGENYYQVKCSPIYDDKMNPIAIVEVFRDVTRERVLELQLIQSNENVFHDMEITKRIQKSILPVKAKYKNIAIDYLYEATETLSGDMFDIFEVEKDTYVIYIADVAGHGIAASMLTMFIRQTVRNLNKDNYEPELALKYISDKFLELNLQSDRYITLFYGVYYAKTEEFVYANAGHNSMPIIFNDNKISVLEAKGRPILSVDLGNNYEVKKTALRAGDKLFLYTDGIVESKNVHGEEFGLDRLIKTILSKPNKLLKAIDIAVLQYSFGDQRDDFAMLLVDIDKMK